MNRRQVVSGLGGSLISTSIAGCLSRFATDSDDSDQEGDQNTPIAGSVSSFQYDTANSGRTEAVGPRDPLLQWKATVPPTYEAPLLYENHFIFVEPGIGALAGFDSRDGTVAWKFGRLSHFQGPGSITDDILITVREEPQSHSHELFAVDLSELYADSSIAQADDANSDEPATIDEDRIEEAILWKYEHPAPHSGQPVVRNETVYAASRESIYAVNLRTGDRAWELDVPASTGFAVGNAGVYVGTHDAELVVVREGAIETRVQLYGEATIPPTVSTGHVLIGDVSGGLHAFTENGDELWVHESRGPVYSSPAVQDDTVYHAEFFGTVMATSIETGESQWSVSLGEDHRRNFASAVTWTTDGVYIASDDGYLFALADGNVKWEHTIETSLASGPVIVDGALAIVTTDPELRVYGAGGT